MLKVPPMTSSTWSFFSLILAKTTTFKAQFKRIGCSEAPFSGCTYLENRLRISTINWKLSETCSFIKMIVFEVRAFFKLAFENHEIGGGD
jgi:hypothetical protein